MDNQKIISPGKWTMEFDEQGNIASVVYDESYRKMLGYENDEEYTNTQSSWIDSFHPEDRERMIEFTNKMLSRESVGMEYDIEYRMMTKNGYRWFHDYAFTQRRQDGTLCHADGVVFDIDNIKKYDIQIKHEKLRSEVFKYMIDNEEDPIELLKKFAERLRVLIDCDQVIYRDLVDTRIMVNSPSIENTWSVPIEYCKKCQHFDAHHPMYKDGYTEMSNCQEGWQGIPVYSKCPIKSSLTRIVYCDEEVAGYLAIHYVTRYHEFSDIERETLEEFTRIISISLSRYKARLANIDKERYEAVHEIIHSGKWSFFINDKDEVIGTDFSDAVRAIVNIDYTDGVTNWTEIIHPDDVDYTLKAFYAAIKDHSGKTPYDVTYRMRDRNGVYHWFHSAGKVIRNEDGSGEFFGIHINISSQIDEQVKQQELLQNNLDIIKALASDYSSVYYIDLATEKVTPVVMDETTETYMSKIFKKSNVFPKAFKAYVDKFVYEPDKEILLTECRKEKVLNKLNKDNNVTITYRGLLNNDIVFCELRFVPAHVENGVIKSAALGFAYKDEQIMAEYINEKLVAEYISAFVVDLEHDKYRIHRYPESTSVMNRENKVWSQAMADFAKECDPEYYELVKNIGTPEFLRSELATVDRREYLYRFPSASKPWRRCVIQVIDRINGIPCNVVATFMGIDEKRASMITLERELANQKILLDYFVDSFSSAFSVDLKEGKFEVLHMEDEYASIIGLKGNKIEDMIKIIDEYAHPDDKDMLHLYSDVNYVINRLREEPSFNLMFREVIGDVTRTIRGTIIKVGDEYHVAIGFMDITEELRKENEIKEKLQETNTFTNYFLDRYVSAYYINFTDFSCTVYKRTTEFENDYPILGNYFESLKEYVDTGVHPDDRKELLKVTTPSQMKKILKKQPEYTHTFKDITGGTEKIYRMQVIRGADEDHAAFGFADITKEYKEQQKYLLGAIPLSNEVLNKANIGLWSFELDEGKPPRMYVDDTMLPLLGLDHQISPEETYHAWYDHVDNDSYPLVNDAVAKMINGEHAEVQYPWHHPDGHIMIVRCGGIRNPEYKDGIRVEGTHQNVSEVLRYDEEEIQRLKYTELQLKHEQLRKEVLDYMVNHEEDPIELLKEFAERIRVLIDCDQVIYRDLEETRIMVNSPEIENTWAVPIEYCKQCEHFDAHHKMYRNGYTKMDNCQEGCEGIPVYCKCPIKSSLTRIVYCDGEVAGYLAIHFVQNYHVFNELEEATLEEFTRILSMSLSRFEAKKRAGELNSVKHTLNMMFALSDQFDPIMILDPNTGEYDWLMSMSSDVDRNTSMTVHGEDLYKNIGIDSAKIIHPDDREKFKAFYTKENLLKIVETGIPQETENRWYIDTDKKYRWKYNKAVRMQDDTGKVYIVIGVIDTTEQKEKEEAINAQKRILEQQQALSDGLAREYHTVWLVEGAGEHKLHLFRSTGVKTVKKALQRGLDEPTYDSTMVKYVNESVHEDDRARVLEESKFENIVKETPEVGIYVISYKRYCDDKGNIDYHQMCFAKAVSEDGTVNYILAFRDADKMLREQIAQQQQLEEALSMAQSANRAKTTFLNNMSHDIRTPMNAIIGYTGLAASHIDNKEQVQDYLSKISQSSDHLLSLINDVLDMSRIESGKMNLEEKEENLSDIIHTLRDIVQADIHSKQLDFYVDVVDVNDENVICDKLRLNQVLLNVLSNAVKYTPVGGTVTMRVRESAVKKSGYGTYEFIIKDNGVGMTEEFLSTIFDPFTRAKSSTVSGIQGTGLGMAISKNIIDMMGGSINIESVPNKGTEVTIIFDFKLQTAHKEPIVIPEVQGLRGLVVDDDANACLSISNMLRDIGMKDEWCVSGKEAVIRAKEAYRRGDAFKVYIIDWLMPDMNGIETTRRIRRVVGKDAPIIILTAYDWSDIEDEAKEAGVTAFVSKPMFPSDLHKVLCNCLGKKDKFIKQKQTYNDSIFVGKKILLVEDNVLNMEIATELLEEYGFIIDTANDGNIAVEKMKNAKAGDYDLVLMDIQMPTMDGYEATRLIRKLGTEISMIPILAMTANAFEEDRKLAIEAGMNAHIAKPIDIDTLKDTLAKFLM